MPGLLAVLLDVRLQECKVPLDLLPDAPRRIAEMAYEQMLLFQLNFELTFLLSDRLVDAPGEGDIRTAAENANGREALDLLKMIVLVKIGNRQHDRLDFRLLDGQCGKIRPHGLRLCKIFVSIEESDPVPRRMRKRFVLRRRKVVAPHIVVDTCARCLGQRLRIILRSRIYNDALIAVDRRVLEPSRHIMRLVTHDRARRNPQRLLPLCDFFPKICALLRHGEHRIVELHRLAVLFVLSVSTKSLFHRRNRLRELHLPCQMLGILGMKLRNARKIASCLFQYTRALLALRKRIEQHAIAAARKKHGTRAICDVEPRVVKRSLLIAHAFIRLGEVAVEILRTLRLLQFLQKESQIALRLALRTTRSIARMEQHKGRFGNEPEAQCTVLALDMLMDAAHIADLRQVAEGPHDIGMINALFLLAVDVEIHDLHGERIKAFRFFKDSTQISARRLGKALIRVEEYDPVACRMRKRRVPRHRKVIAPRAAKELHLGQSLCNAARIVLRASIIDDDLIDARRYALNGCGDICALVLRDIAS